jgi:para-nitrobenzyl esterase
MTKNQSIARVTAIAMMMMTACGGDAPSAPPEAGDVGDAGGDTPVPGSVVTDRGVVVGHSDGAITSFLGIPYAAPPIGALRWRPPQPHAAWSAPIDAAALGPACAQSDGGLGQTGPYSEDCLTLNVWTPAAAANAPVMVFIHGGAFVHGSSNQAGYDGRALAARGVVAVTLNYRLGAFGFLAHPALTAEDEHHSSGNTGLLDQQAALRWVQTNIAAFGGDPANVTLFGESAGAMSVCAQIASPLAAGLFHRGIGESGACLLMATPLVAPVGTTRASAEALGVTVAQALGCDTAADVLGCLRAKPAAEVIAAVPGSDDDVVKAGVKLEPNIDGYVLAEPPAAAFAAGRVGVLDGFLGGINHDEATLFTRQKTLETADDYAAAVTALVPAHADEALALYPAADYASFRDAYNALITDVVFACPTRAEVRLLAARGTPTYLYVFTRLTAFGTAIGLDVYHGSELPFVFGNLTARSGMSSADRAFSDQVMTAWTSFATTGSPTTTPAWPRSGDADAHVELGEPSQVATGFHAAQCDAIASWRAVP